MNGMSIFDKIFRAYWSPSDLNMCELLASIDHWLLRNGQKPCFWTFAKDKFTSISATTGRIAEISHVDMSHLPLYLTIKPQPLSMDICFFTELNAEPTCKTRLTVTTGGFSLKLSTKFANTLLHITGKFHLLLTLSWFYTIILPKKQLKLFILTVR